MTRAGISDTALDETVTRSPSNGLAEPEAAGVEPSATRVQRSASRIARRHDTLLIALAVAVGFLVRAIFAPGDHIVGTDESVYLTSGLNFWSGNGFTTLSGGAQVHFPPGLPLLLGGVHKLIGGDPHTATVIVNLVTTTLVILPIAGIAGIIKDRRTAVLAAWIAALCPAITWLTVFAGGSSGPFTLLVITALWLGLRSSAWSAKPALLGAAGAGALIGLAYLTRPEGLLYSVVLVPVLALPALGGWRGLRRASGKSWRRAGSRVAAFAIPVFLLAAPYVAYLHTHTGAWQLTAKSNAMSIEAWRAVSKGERAASLAEQFSLDETGYRFAQSQDIGNLMLEDPDGFLGIVGTNFSQLYTTVFNASSTPYPNWQLLPGLLYLLAGFALWRFRHSRAALATAAAIAIPVVTALSYFVLHRYLIPAAALTCALIAVGLLELPRKWVKAAIVGAFVLLASSAAAGLYGNANGWFHPNYAYPERREVGEWIGEHSRPGDLIMGTSNVVGYYAHRNVVPIPYAPQRDVIEFGQHYGVRYLVLDQAYTVRFRPHLRTLLFNNRWQSLRAVRELREGTRRTIIYEFVPRAPRFDGEIPLLEHIGES